MKAERRAKRRAIREAIEATGRNPLNFPRHTWSDTCEKCGANCVNTSWLHFVEEDVLRAWLDTLGGDMGGGHFLCERCQNKM